ncbi:hypothetical protein LTR28_011997 [Elasticomyces elasticus]|nr:hypothetical protein LTR28_011997 [Elasticomyces elasticus]
MPRPSQSATALLPHRLVPALFAISACLSIATLGCAGHLLHLFHSQRQSSPWWLPVWPQHFDTRGTEASIGAAAAVVVVDVLGLFLAFGRAWWCRVVPLACALVGASLALVALVTQAVFEHASGVGTRDTLRTWTCGWSAVGVEDTGGDAAVPGDFGSICRESAFLNTESLLCVGDGEISADKPFFTHQQRFTFFATIPLFILHLLLLCATGYATRTQRASDRFSQPGLELNGTQLGSRSSTSSTNAKNNGSAKDSVRVSEQSRGCEV